MLRPSLPPLRPLRSTRAFVVCGGLALFVDGLVAACGDGTIHEYCTNIPDGGCPSPVNNCVDPTCRTIYARNDDCSWTFLVACPTQKPSKDAAADGEGSRGAGHGVRLRDAGLVLPDGAAGGSGCEALEAPDCPLVAPLECTSCCGCQSLYVCGDGGWNLWGQCLDGGPRPTPR